LWEYTHSPATIENARRQRRAHSRALRRLARLHAAEFAALYNEERIREGLRPLDSDGQRDDR
jgi:hypothetical protein